MSEWKECKLGDVAKIKNGFAFKSKDFVDEGIPVIKIKNVKPNKILLDTLSYVSPDVAKGKEYYLIKPKDILITMSGNRADGSPASWVGKVSQFKVEGDYLLNQRVSIIQVNEELASISFVGYNLSSWQTQLYLINNANSSGGQANISPDIVKGIDLELPPLPEQKAIASVLSSFDDKIDLLHRQNKTLEAMAETLFRQWFVEEAKEDWDDGKIGDLFFLQRGFDLPIQKRVAGPYPIFAASGRCGYHNEPKVKVPGVTTGRSGLLGKVFFIMEDFWPLNTSLFIKEYRIGTPLFCYFSLKTIDLEGFNAGSAVPTLNRNHLHEYNTPIPPRALIEEFENLIMPCFRKIQFNRTQVRILEKLRDTLLPKLMSGEVRVAYDKN